MFFEPTGKAVKVIGLLQFIIILLGMIISGVEIKLWKLYYPFDMYGDDGLPPGVWIFLAYYGVVLFLIPLIWTIATSFFSLSSSIAYKKLLVLYYSGYAIIFALFIFNLLASILPWGHAPDFKLGG
jgi:hypothetical protein